MLSSPTKTLGRNLGTTDTQKLLHQAIQQHAYSEAIDLLNQLICQDANNSSYYSNRGLIHYHCQQWSQAIMDYSQALRLNPKNDSVYVRRARCNTVLKHWKEAIADYDDAIRINPQNIRARINQGILFRELGMHDDAIVCFDLALFMSQPSATIYAERGRTYHLDGYWNYAMGDYQKSLELLRKAPNQLLKLKLSTWLLQLLANQ